jgi:hypothetical protein
MLTPEHKIIAQLGESTAYSAKNHFKGADVRRITSITLITINIIVSVLTLTTLITSNTALQLLSAGSLAASIYLLTLESRDGQSNPEKHNIFGNKYLALHNEAFALYQQQAPSKSDVEKLQKKVNELNQTERPHINPIARWKCKRAIEMNGEMNIWWK